MTRHLDKHVGEKQGRPVFIEAGCDATDPFRSLGRLVGTKANATGVSRPVYVKAECEAGATAALSTGRALGRLTGTKANGLGISRPVYVRTCCGVSTVCCPGVVIPSTLVLTIENIDFPGTCWGDIITPITFVPGSLPSAIWKSPTFLRVCAGVSVIETFRLKCFDRPSGVFGFSFPFPPDPTESSGTFIGGGLWLGAVLTCSPFSFVQGITNGAGERYLFTVTA